MAKRFTKSAVDFKKVAELVGEGHAKEVANLAHQHHQFWSEVISRPAELPKYDFAALKKQMPEHKAVLESLQKQYEAIKIPFGTIPESHLKEIDKFLSYVDAKTNLLDRKIADAKEDEKKVQARYVNMPPIEHFRREHYAQFFPEKHRDVRLPIDRLKIGWGSTNTPEHFEELKELFKDYRSRPVPEHLRD